MKYFLILVLTIEEILEKLGRPDDLVYKLGYSNNFTNLKQTYVVRTTLLRNWVAPVRYFFILAPSLEVYVVVKSLLTPTNILV